MLAKLYVGMRVYHTSISKSGDKMKINEGVITSLGDRVNVSVNSRIETFDIGAFMQLPLYEVKRHSMLSTWQETRNKSLPRHRGNFRKLFKTIVKETE